MKPIIVIIILLFSINLHSHQEPAILDDQLTSTNLGIFSSVFIDTNNSYTLEGLLNKEYFTPFKTDFLQLNKVIGTVWIKTEISIQKSTNNTSYIYIKAPLIDDIEVYFPQFNQHTPKYSANKNNGASLYSPQHTDHITPIPDSSHNSITVYIKIRSSSPINIQLMALDNTQLLKLTFNNLLFSSFFISVMLIFIIGSIFFFLHTKHSMYLAYSSVLLSMLSLHLCFHGFMHYILTNGMEFEIRTFNFSILSYLTASILFSRYYLDTQINFPKIDRILLSLGGVNIFLVSLFLINTELFNKQFLLLNLLITSSVLVAIAFFIYSKKATYSGYYILAKSIVFLGIYAWVMSVYGIYPSAAFYKWGLTTVLLIEASIYFSGIITHLSPFRATSLNQKAVSVQDSAPSNIISDTGKRLKRQINILDNYIAYWRATPLKDNEKLLSSDAAIASNNLKLLSNNLTLLNSFNNKSSAPILLDKVIQDTIDDFNNIDQDNADITFENINTTNIELLSDSHLYKQLLINLAQEYKHLNENSLTIRVQHKIHSKLGINTIEIVCSPISNRINNSFNSSSLGLHAIKHIAQRLEGNLDLSNTNNLTIKLPANTRTRDPLHGSPQAEPAQIFVIGEESILVERVLRSLQSWPNDVIQIININDLITNTIIDTNNNTVNLVLMFEHEGYIPNLALKQVRGKLHAGDQCILVTDNAKMSRNYALTLGFDDLFSDLSIELNLKENLDRFTSKGLRIKKASLQTQTEPKN